MLCGGGGGGVHSLNFAVIFSLSLEENVLKLNRNDCFHGNIERSLWKFSSYCVPKPSQSLSRLLGGYGDWCWAEEEKGWFFLQHANCWQQKPSEPQTTVVMRKTNVQCEGRLLSITPMSLCCSFHVDLKYKCINFSWLKGNSTNFTHKGQGSFGK